MTSIKFGYLFTLLGKLKDIINKSTQLVQISLCTKLLFCTFLLGKLKHNYINMRVMNIISYECWTVINFFNNVLSTECIQVILTIGFYWYGVLYSINVEF